MVTWNIRYGIEFRRAAHELGGDQRLAHADLLLLQEMDEEGTAHIAQALDAHDVYTSSAPHPHTGRDFGNAIVTRLPILERYEIPLPHAAPVSGQPRSATHAVIRIGDREVAVYSVHTEIPLLRLARRIEQFEAVAAHAGATRRPVIVGGDFNTVTRRGRRTLATSMAVGGLERVVADGPPSYQRLGRDLALDHLFVRGLEVRESGVVPVTNASDHRPLWSDLIGDL